MQQLQWVFYQKPLYIPLENFYSAHCIEKIVKYKKSNVQTLYSEYKIVKMMLRTHIFNKTKTKIIKILLASIL